MSAADAALHAIVDANRLLRDAGEKLAAAVGQTHARRMVLQAAGDGATVPDIARRLGVHRQGTQRITDELVADGLGRYAENPRHRLSKLFVPTDQGTAVLGEIHRAHAEWVGRIETRAARIDWHALHDELDELALVLRDDADPEPPPA